MNKLTKALSVAGAIALGLVATTFGAIVFLYFVFGCGQTAHGIC